MNTWNRFYGTWSGWQSFAGSIVLTPTLATGGNAPEVFAVDKVTNRVNHGYPLVMRLTSR